MEELREEVGVWEEVCMREEVGVKELQEEEAGEEPVKLSKTCGMNGRRMVNKESGCTQGGE